MNSTHYEIKTVDTTLKQAVSLRQNIKKLFKGAL